MERYLTSPDFEDMESFSDYEGDQFIIRSQFEGEMMREDEMGPSNKKRPREFE